MKAQKEQEEIKILIVEDEALVAKDLANRLSGLGYSVCGKASTGETAIELVKQHMPDLVMMDIVLKGEMDGIDAAEVIKEKWSIPVVFLTAYADTDKLERAKLAYPFGYILKPFKDGELKATLEIALYVSKVDAKRRKAEENLRRSEMMLARTEGIAQVGSWEWEIKTDKVTWSEELFRIFQLDPRQGGS